MYKILCTTLAIIALSATLPLTAPAQTLSSSDAGAIAKQLQRYELTLNAADIDGIMELYAENAVFMPQHSLPVVGRDAVRSAYRHVFDTIKLNIRFEIDEVRPLSSDWAFARTRSTGAEPTVSNKSLAGSSKPSSSSGNVVMSSPLDRLL